MTPRTSGCAILLLFALAWSACGRGGDGEGKLRAPSGSPNAAASSPSDLDQLLGPSFAWRRRLAPRERARAPERAAERAVLPGPILQRRVHRFRGRLQTAEAILLQGNLWLEFLPLVQSRPLDGCVVELDLLAGSQTWRLWTGAPEFGGARLNQSEALVRFARSERIPLEAHRGRRVFLRWTVQGPCAGRNTLLASPRLVPALRPVPAAPSILLVCSDAHRFDYAFGDPGRRLMPRLREIAGESVVYRRAFSNASWTLPSIASTLTGLFPRFHRTGVRIETGVWNDRERRRVLPPGQFSVGWGGAHHIFTAYPDRLSTLGERLQKGGYATAAVVSNVFYTSSGLLDEGFDVVLDTNGVPGSEVNRLAFEVLERFDPDRPLLLLVHYMDVHEYWNWAGRDGSETDRDVVLAEYARRVEDTDRHLGALLAVWDRDRGLAESLISFYADHGEHLGEPDRLGAGHGGSMDEVLLHIPFLVHYPRSLGIPPGTEERPVSLVDLAPTLLEAAGIPQEGAPLHGTSLLQLNGLDPTSARQVHADYQLSGDELSSVRAGSKKFLVNLTRGTRELVEPGETGGLVPETRWRVEDPVQQADLERAYETYTARAEAFGAELRSSRVIDAEELEERLRAIGYVE